MLKLWYQYANQEDDDDRWWLHSRPFSNDWKTKIIETMVGVALRNIFSGQWKQAKITYVLGEVMWHNKYGFELVTRPETTSYKQLERESRRTGIELHGWYDVDNCFHVEPQTMYKKYPKTRGY